MAPMCKMLIVDDNTVVLRTMVDIFTKEGFDVTSAETVPEALKLISSDVFDVLLTDLHMPGAGDGLTVVSAMRHANSKAVTVLLTAFPEMDAAAFAMLRQTDQILVKPMDPAALIATIRLRIAMGPPAERKVEPVSALLARTSFAISADWYSHLMAGGKVSSIQMSMEQRCAHLPQFIDELVARLRSLQATGAAKVASSAAAEYGRKRYRAGYSAYMLIEEARMLQFSVYHTIQTNLTGLDFSLLLNDVMGIADEIDCQLVEAMASFSTYSERVTRNAPISIAASGVACRYPNCDCEPSGRLTQGVGTEMECRRMGGPHMVSDM